MIQNETRRLILIQILAHNYTIKFVDSGTLGLKNMHKLVIHPPVTIK